MPLIDVGQVAPDFDLKDQFGKSHRLKDYRGRIVVLYFYPEDDTPLCTQQACQFRDHHPDFTKIKGVILGVSPQGSASKKMFVEKHALPFTLLADEVQTPAGPKVCVAYGAWGDKNMYGKIVRSMLRTAIKKVRKAIDAGDKAAAQAVFKESQSVIDSIADKKIVHKNLASRQKSRLSAAIKAL